MSAESKTSSGIGFFGLLAIVLITLKLLGKITWSWWLILSPLWGGFAFFFLVCCGVLLLAALWDGR